MTLVISALFGLIIGSFLNVCIYRIPRKISLTAPRRSFCPHCSSQLTCWENVPLLSWCCLLGHCRYCKQPISARYPLVEFLSAAAAVAAVIKFGETATAFTVYSFTAALIAITFIDLDFKIIPNVISYPFTTIGLLLGIASQYSTYFAWPLTQSAIDSFIGMYLGGGFFYLVGKIYYWVTKREGLGGGDIKFMGMTGAMLGWHAVPFTIFMGCLFGAFFGVSMMIFRGTGRHTEIPFGPWLALGAVLYMFTNIPVYRF